MAHPISYLDNSRELSLLSQSQHPLQPGLHPPIFEGALWWVQTRLWGKLETREGALRAGAGQGFSGDPPALLGLAPSGLP